MTAFMFLLLVTLTSVGGFPGKWKERRPGHHLGKNVQFEDWALPPRSGDKTPWKDGRWGREEMEEYHSDADEMIPNVRWCVTSPCEMKKCLRMTMEFNYMVQPKLHWVCTMAASKEMCMEEIQYGHADIMTAEGEEIYQAGKIYDMMPVMYEKEDHSTIPDYSTMFSVYEDAHGDLKHYSIALVKKTNTEVNSFQAMKQRKSCHAGVDMPATFKSPVCSLIHKGVIPRVGNAFESAGEFFTESCVPGLQHDWFNPNMTNPENLCKLCKGEDNEDFCENLCDKEPYYGFSGALKCLRDSQGDVGFFHTHDVMQHYDTLSKEFDIVCKNGKLPLKWQNIVKKECHVSEEYPQVVMVSANKPKDWVKNCTSALLDASNHFSSKTARNAFNLFDSTPYCPMKTDDDEDEELDDVRMMNKNLIFKEHSSSLAELPEDRMTYKTFFDTDTVNKWKDCGQLEPKPRAFICVVGDEQMTKCKKMINHFMTIPDVNKVSWGCIEANSQHECVETVEHGMADIINLNATEMFLAGMDHNLSPFMGENIKGKKPWTEGITVGVMMKDGGDLSKGMKGWKTCGAGVNKISGFLHPMGWLLANGSIPRSSSPLKSIRHHLGESCVPGMNTLDIVKHPLLSRTLDWADFLKHKEVHWHEWYEDPLWRKWDHKRTGVSDEYEPMHEMSDFESENFQMMIQRMMSDDPSLLAQRTPEIHEILMKARSAFSWDNYDGLKDLYSITPPPWKMISYVWDKPEDWDEGEWTMFLTWIESRWDQEEDWASYMDDWTSEDWKTFKEWMDAEYQEYLTNHKPIHQDIFIRLSLLCSRFEWLMSQWKNLQWDNVEMKHCREHMCKSCAGQGEHHCSMDTATEDYYGYEGALKCLMQDDGDVAFMDAYHLDDAITKMGFAKDDFTLLCPDGSTVDYTGPEAYDECHFGHVPSHALVTCNMHDPIWRWKVTKALLKAQEVLSQQKTFDLFKDGIFGDHYESLTPIPLVNQTYQVWLGPMFLRAMESLLQPPAKHMGWTKNSNADLMDGDDQDRHSCDDCEEDDDMCLENCWSAEDMPPRRHQQVPVGHNKMMKMGGKKKGYGMHNMPSKQMRKIKSHKMIMVWKPSGGRMHNMMERKHMKYGMRPMMHDKGLMMHGQGPMMYGKGPMMYGKGPMKYRKGMMKYGMKSMKYGKGPMKYGMGSMVHGMEYMKHGMKSMKYGMRPKMWGKMKMGHGKHGMDYMGQIMSHAPIKYGMDDMEKIMSLAPMKYGLGKMGYMDETHMKSMMMKIEMMDHPMHKKMGHHYMETGPMMHGDRSLRGEFYTNVIFARDGTCNAVVHDLTCFGKPKKIKMPAGRIGKTMVSVPMCPHPAVVKKTTAQFTCETGANFWQSVELPVRCAYVPCDKGFVIPKWSEDNYWDAENAYPGDYWGTKDWWSFDKRGDNDNWFPADRSKNQIDKSERISFGKWELKWPGQQWRPM